jgi:alkylhydroperoxidase/carboxymuconolactone decarboxylase family protein YurZ
MATLNQGAAEAMCEAGASGCTDISGFGLFAHLRRMLRPAGLSAEIFADALPAFVGALGALRQGIIPGAIERNREYVGDSLLVGPGVDEAVVNLGFDAQTSGGLLIAIPGGRLKELRWRLAQRGAGAFVVGKIVSGGAAELVVMPGAEFLQADSISTPPMKDPEPKVPTPKAEVFPGAEVKRPAADPRGPQSPAPQSSAAASRAAAPPAPARLAEGGADGSAAAAENAFAALLQSVQTAGALGEKTKALILFSLALAGRSEPGFESHLRRARDLGLTQAELDEAAWCAISLGGAPVKLFYQGCLEKHEPASNSS